MPMDDIFNAFFGGNPFANIHSFPGMQQHGTNIHIFRGGIPSNFQQSLNKPSPIIKNVSIDMEQVLNGTTIPIDVERWIIDGGNKVFENETLYLNIPQGVDDGEIIILRDKGNIVNENIKGDIKVFIKIINNTIFKRSGLDLIFEKQITLKESLCGFSFEVKYINDKNYTLNNNKGNIIHNGYKKIYPNMGLKRDTHHGNMVIIFNVIFPEKLSEEQVNKLIEIL
jgi:DnaJ-class molecular chaperone